MPAPLSRGVCKYSPLVKGSESFLGRTLKRLRAPDTSTTVFLGQRDLKDSESKADPNNLQKQKICLFLWNIFTTHYEWRLGGRV
jgi:hypothetical protein